MNVAVIQLIIRLLSFRNERGIADFGDCHSPKLSIDAFTTAGCSSAPHSVPKTAFSIIAGCK